MIDQLDHLGRDLDLFQVNELEPRLLGEGAAEIDLGNLSRTHQDLPDRLACFLLLGKSLLDIVLGHQTHLLEDLAMLGQISSSGVRR